MGLITKGIGVVLKGRGGSKATRDAIAKGLREHRASESYKMHKKTMKKYPMI